MKVYKKLKLTLGKKDKIIYFGIPNTSDEFVGMYKTRMSVYSKKDYFHDKVYENNPASLDIDEYDRQNKCTYFIAKIEGRVIGSLRLIQDNYLPAEKYFEFIEPKEMGKIPRTSRAEISRLVVERYSEDEHPPRNIIMMLLLDSAAEFMSEKKIIGGFSFVKEKLQNKFKKLRAPIHLIPRYIQSYPEDGILYKYFNQKEDPVLPAYFLTSEICEYMLGILENKMMFEKTGKSSYLLKDSFYNSFLKKLKII